MKVGCHFWQQRGWRSFIFADVASGRELGGRQVSLFFLFVDTDTQTKSTSKENNCCRYRQDESNKRSERGSI